MHLKFADIEVTQVDTELLQDSDMTVVNSARVSFNEWNNPEFQRTEKLIAYLAENGHWSPFAHPQMRLRVKAPLYLAAQLKKHTVGLVWNEISRRYVTEDVEFYTRDMSWNLRPAKSIKQGTGPKISWPMDEELRALYSSVVMASYSAYLKAVALGVAPEQARRFLPVSTMTQWIWTGSLAAFARVYNQRSHPHAQLEAQEFASKLGRIIEAQFPISARYLLDNRTKNVESASPAGAGETEAAGIID